MAGTGETTMSKARKITGVDIYVRHHGAVWVWILFDDGSYPRSYHTDNPERRARLLKRARQMQGLIMGNWYKKQKRVIAIGATGRDLPSLQRPTNPAFDEDDTAVLAILTGPTKQEMETADYQATIASPEAGIGRK
jgi:hypothetical protein